MNQRLLFAALAVGTLLTACASNPARTVRSEFEDIPVPKGLTYEADESTVIETTSIKAVRQVYRGRLEPESLATAIRSTLEANGWRHVSTTSAGDHGVTQVYEKAQSSLEVRLLDGWWYTFVELTASRAQQQATK